MSKIHPLSAERERCFLLTSPFIEPAQIYANNAENLGEELSRDVSRQPH
jgi:hypothetical protein